MKLFELICAKHGSFRLILQDGQNVFIIITTKDEVRYVRFENEDMTIDELILFEVREDNLFANLLRVHQDLS